MKVARLAMIAAVAILLAIGVSTTGNAFHSGGVAECVGCHEMHGASGPSLLKGTDQSSTCMQCHANSEVLNGGVGSSYHVVNYPTPASGVPPAEMTPGGDFAWLQKSYYFTVRGGANTDLGQTHGHNIIAADFTGYTVDTDNPTAPGGIFPSANLTCISCHNQHGKGRLLPGYTYGVTGAPIVGSGSYQSSPEPSNGLAVGVYRLLRFNETVGGVTFPLGPPLAITNSTYNRSEFYFQTRTAYGSGMSDFCGTCHPDMHSTAGFLRHPQGAVISGATQAKYNSYVKSGDLTGTSATAYLSLVPFEEGLTVSAASNATLKSHAVINNTQLGGMSGAATVMCVSCHRSHASGFPEMTRWNNEGEFMVYNGVYPGTDTTPTVPQFARGRSSVETAASYYNKPVSSFATYQRVLCNKCHAQD